MSSEDNEKINFKYTNLQLRRDKVLELTAQGLQQSIIAERLGVSQSTISVDLQWARETAKSRMQTHIEERIPLQFEECTIGLRLLLRKAHEVIEEKSSRVQDKLNAINSAADIYSKLMDLSTNGSILQRTLQWLETKKKIELTPEEQKRMEEVLSTTEEEEDGEIDEEEKELPKEE